jgi:hypothetical protein
MKKLITPIAILLLAFSLSTNAFAQTWGFAQAGHWAYDVVAGPDGNYWASGYSGDAGDWSDVTAGYVVKLDANGEKLFSYNPFGFGDGGYAQSVMPTEGGGAGVLYTNGLSGNQIVKLDNTGATEWTSDGWGADYFFYGGYGAVLADGKFVVAGLTDFEHSFYALDEDGNFLSSWTVAPDTGAVWEWSYWNYKEVGMTATADGGFAYATGNNGNKIVYKYDSDLNLEWASYLPWEATLNWEYGYQNGLKTTSDGGLLLSGSGTNDLGTYVGIVRKLDADGNLEWSSVLSHAGVGAWEEGGWGLEMADGNYVAFTQNAGEASTHGWILDGATGAEIDSVFIPIMSAPGGFAETGLEIWDVDYAADGGILLAGRMYLEDFDQRFTVIKSNADGTFDDCIFNCVWPGDANNDGYADGSDLFEIGINFGATGTPRADMGIDWDGKLAQAWMEPDSVYWYILNDLKWTDCNGDGTINDDDTTAVINNMGLDHPLNNVRLEGGEAPLYFAPASDVLSIGLNEIPIMLGDDITSVDDIYGITFTINVDADVIDAAALKISFDDAWIGNIGETLQFSKTFGDTKQVVGTIVRKDRENTSGAGQIGTLSIVVVDNITGKTEAEEVELSFSGVTAIKIDREVIPVAAVEKTMTAEENAGVENPLAEGLSIYPNPATDVLNVINTAAEAIVGIKITDLTGKVVYENNSTNGLSNTIDISTLPAGNFVIEINRGNSISTQTVSIQ